MPSFNYPSIVSARVANSNDINQANIDKNNIQIKVFPNPSDSKINILFGNNSSGFYCANLFDMQGKSILNELKEIKNDDYSLELDVNSLANGCYILQLSVDGLILNYYKVIIIH